MMKKIFKILSLTLVISLVFLSCKKEINKYPNINFIGGQDIISQNTSLKPNETFRIGINSFPRDKYPLYNFKLTRTYNNENEIIIDSVLNTNNFNVILTCPTGEYNQDDRWSFSISNSKGYTSEISILIRTCDTITYVEKNKNLVKNYIMTDLPGGSNDVIYILSLVLLVIVFIIILLIKSRIKKKGDCDLLKDNLERQNKKLDMIGNFMGKRVEEYENEIEELKRKLNINPRKKRKWYLVIVIAVLVLFYIFLIWTNYLFLFF